MKPLYEDDTETRSTLTTGDKCLIGFWLTLLAIVALSFWDILP